MTEWERAILEAHRGMLGIDQAAAQQIVHTYDRVAARLNANLRALTGRIREARQAGEEVRPVWLWREERYVRLIEQLEEHTHDWAASAQGAITNGQAAAVDHADGHSRRLIVVGAGPAPDNARRQLAATFMRLPAIPLDEIVGLSTDGRPIGRLLSELAPGNVQGVRDALAFGVAAGKGPRAIAREVQRASGSTLARALTISRTETLRAHRQATDYRYQQTQAVMEWAWHATLSDGRTCVVCLAMHGTRHPVGTPLASHPNCRCTMIPRTRSWAELGFRGIPDQRPTITPGVELFERLDREAKLRMVGPGKLAALEAGEIELRDLVQRTRSPRWGPGRRERSLQSALALSR